MSDTSEPSKTVKPMRSTPQKLTASKGDDLQLVAERLALILGHISQMPNICISGVRMMDGFLLVALRVEGHELSIVSGVWMLDGKDITIY
jgi:hypothetical protein